MNTSQIIWTILLIVGLVALVITWEIFKRKVLADKGRFWVRVPFMKYLAIEVDRVLMRVLVACTTEVWERIHPECVTKPCDIARDGNIEIIRVHKGLKWIGVPWKYRVKEWYETESDELDPNTPPLHSVGLEQQVLRYTRSSPKNSEDEKTRLKPEKDEIEVPSLTTADLIEISADIVINTVVYNPIKALYYIRHRKTAIFNMILPVWREVVGNFFFFEYGDTLEKDFKAVVGKKIVKLSSKFRVALGISREEGDEEKEVQITDPLQLVPGSVAHMIFNEWGTLIRYAAIEDVDPADPEIKKTFEKMITAVTEALAAKQRAEGERDAAIIKGQGYKDEPARFKLAMETIQALAASGNLIISLPETSESIAGFMASAMKSFRGGDKK